MRVYVNAFCGRVVSRKVVSWSFVPTWFSIAKMVVVAEQHDQHGQTPALLTGTNWQYKAETVDVSGWRTGSNGCIEERDTYIIDDYDNVDLTRALDLNIDLVPTAVLMLSGFWHQVQDSGQPLKNTTLRIPGPSSRVFLLMSKYSEAFLGSVTAIASIRLASGPITAPPHYCSGISPHPAFQVIDR